MRNNHNPNIGAVFYWLAKQLSLFSLTSVLKHISLLDVSNVREKWRVPWFEFRHRLHKKRIKRRKFSAPHFNSVYSLTVKTELVKTSAFVTVAICVFLCSLIIAQNNENSVFYCLTNKARKIKKSKQTITEAVHASWAVWHWLPWCTILWE